MNGEAGSEGSKFMAMLRRIGSALVNEFTGQPAPRPTPSKKEFAEGSRAEGKIESAIEDTGGEIQGADYLNISIAVPGGDMLHRQVVSPLSSPGSGRRLVGYHVPVRHTTFDPDFANDVLVVRWPAEVEEALAPFRPTGPGAMRARAWNVLAGFGQLLVILGIPVSFAGLLDLIFSLFGALMFSDVIPGYWPGLVLLTGLAALVLGGCCAILGDSRVAAFERRREQKANP